jgi:hypothetical protein
MTLQTKRAKCTQTQIRQVFKYMHNRGSINRYEADQIGVCGLAPRIKDLEERDAFFIRYDENNIADFHGTLHNGIRRYSIDWKRMSDEATAYFKEWLK